MVWTKSERGKKNNKLDKATSAFLSRVWKIATGPSPNPNIKRGEIGGPLLKGALTHLIKGGGRSLSRRAVKKPSLMKQELTKIKAHLRSGKATKKSLSATMYRKESGFNSLLFRSRSTPKNLAKNKNKIGLGDSFKRRVIRTGGDDILSSRNYLPKKYQRLHDKVTGKNPAKIEFKVWRKGKEKSIPQSEKLQRSLKQYRPYAGKRTAPTPKEQKVIEFIPKGKPPNQKSAVQKKLTSPSSKYKQAQVGDISSAKQNKKIIQRHWDPPKEATIPKILRGRTWRTIGLGLGMGSTKLSKEQSDKNPKNYQELGERGYQKWRKKTGKSSKITRTLLYNRAKKTFK